MPMLIFCCLHVCCQIRFLIHHQQQLPRVLICMELQFWMHVSKLRHAWSLLLHNKISALLLRYSCCPSFCSHHTAWYILWFFSFKEEYMSFFPLRSSDCNNFGWCRSYLSEVLITTKKEERKTALMYYKYFNKYKTVRRIVK